MWDFSPFMSWAVRVSQLMPFEVQCASQREFSIDWPRSDNAREREREGGRERERLREREREERERLRERERETERKRENAQKLPTPPNDQALCLSPADVRKTLSRINPRKAAGPDNIPGRVLKDCAAQLTDVLTDIFNTSLSQAVVPTCLKSTTIIPVPNKSPVSCLNDYRPIVLTPIMKKCFERLVMQKIKTSLPNTLDPLQFFIPSKPLYGQCNFLHPPSGSYPPRK